MKIRTQFILYLLVLHLSLGAALGYIAWQYQPFYVIVVELIMLLSFLMAFRLFRLFYEPMQLLQSSASMLRDADFSTTLAPVGQIEADAITEVYNTMLLSLRAERVRVEEQGFLLQALMNSSPTGILLCTERHTILRLNPILSQMIDGFAPSSTGKHISAVNAAFADLVTMMNQGSSEIFTQRFRRFKIRKDGFVERGMPHIVIMIEELTSELDSSEKTAYERIIRVLAHEVNNSVGAVRSLLESTLFYERYFVPDMEESIKSDFRDALSVAKERLAELAEFMREYALLVRLPSPKRLSIDVCELPAVIEKLFREICKNESITLRVEVPAEPMMIEADKMQLQQALTNLTKNAVEAMRHSPEKLLILSVCKQQAAIAIAVEDSGMGLDSQTSAQILTPFFTTKETGQGIGLMLVREIVKAHGFDFLLENRSQRGAKAEIIIPIVQ